MIEYHETTNQNRVPYFNALVDKLIYIPYNISKEYVKKRAKYFEENLKNPEYNMRIETMPIL
jgi:hypothetical protein